MNQETRKNSVALRGAKLATIALTMLAACAASAAPTSTKTGGSSPQPYSAYLSISDLGYTGTSGFAGADQAVPPGKRFVVENISYQINVTPGTQVDCTIGVDANQPQRVQFVPPPALVYKDTYLAKYQTSYPTRFTIPEGDFYVGCENYSGYSGGDLHMYLTGTLEDAL